jgi:hypothetical protein
LSQPRYTPASIPVSEDYRIHGELLELRIGVSRATVARRMIRSRKQPSPTWRAFLDNHFEDLISIDFFCSKPSPGTLPLVI